MGSSSAPNIVGACRQDNVVVGRVVEERAYTVEWRDYVGQESLSCGVQRKVEVLKSPRKRGATRV